MGSNLWRSVFSELIGTFFLVISILFSIAGSLSDDNVDNLLPVALATSGTLFALIDALGPSSGCHVNPVVTLALMLVKRCNPVTAVLFCIAQFVGSILASLVTLWVLPQEWAEMCSLGANALPSHVTECQGLAVEALTTMLLVLTVLVVSDKHPDGQYKGFASLSVSIVLMACIIFAGPLSSASLNPARSLGPALVQMNFSKDHWVFWAGPVVGSLLAVFAYEGAIKQGLQTKPSPLGYQIIGEEATPCLQENLESSFNTHNK